MRSRPSRATSDVPDGKRSGYGYTRIMSGGWLIFLIFIVLMVPTLAYINYTRGGSGITQRPNDGLDGAPGAAGASRISPDSDHDVGIDTHGTR